MSNTMPSNRSLKTLNCFGIATFLSCCGCSSILVRNDTVRTEILATLPPSLKSYGGTSAALCARVMFLDIWLPKVALADSGNLGLYAGAPLGHLLEQPYVTSNRSR